VEDLASEILLWTLKRDKRAQDEGETEPPRYTKVCLKHVGIDALRRGRRTHRYANAPVFVSFDLRSIRCNDTPETDLLAREAVALEIRRRRRAGRVVPVFA